MLRLVDPELDAAIPVAAAARLLGCNESTVRHLVTAGLLAGHRVGKAARPRAIRVSLQSIQRYKERHAIQAAAEPEPGPIRRHGPTPAMREANSRLKALGIL